VNATIRNSSDRAKKIGLVAAIVLAACTIALHPSAAHPRTLQSHNGTVEDSLSVPGEIGRAGGHLVVSLRAEPKTLNPLIAGDAPSRQAIGAMQADLIHINRATQLTEPSLAKSWTVSRDGLQYTIKLRQGLRFSDGHPVDADDILFSFQLYLDENVHAPQRDLLIVGGKPIVVRKTDSHTVVFKLAKPYGAAERLFDGLAILPKHLLEQPYKQGKLDQQWPLAVTTAQIAGLGPYRFKEYVAGQRLVLERNPYYWKTDTKGNRLPYLDELDFLFVPSADAEVIRFQSGETDIIGISRVGADSFSALSRQSRGYTMADAGAGLEYNFLFFNLNSLDVKASPDLSRKQKWFANVKFRQAVSLAIDRQAIVRLVYQGRGAALWGPVTPGNRRWQNTSLTNPTRSVDAARELLRAAGFSWKKDSTGESSLVDASGAVVEFSIVTSSSNAERTKMATLIQDDLKQLGMRVQVVPLEFRSLLDRVLQTKEYDACVLGVVNYDADPNADINVWLSSGGSHFWNLGQPKPATPWETEIDQLMEKQLASRTFDERKRSYDRIQEIIRENQPLIFLASPDILAGAKNTIGNFHPAILEPYVLWNVEQLFFHPSPGGTRP
jgi:peptide/nickel transport system substrate-binding protein